MPNCITIIAGRKSIDYYLCLLKDTPHSVTVAPAPLPALRPLIEQQNIHLVIAEWDILSLVDQSELAELPVPIIVVAEKEDSAITNVACQNPAICQVLFSPLQGPELRTAIPLVLARYAELAKGKARIAEFEKVFVVSRSLRPPGDGLFRHS